SNNHPISITNPTWDGSYRIDYNEETLPPNLNIQCTKGLIWGRVILGQSVPIAQKPMQLNQGIMLERNYYVSETISGKETLKKINNQTILKTGDKIVVKLRIKADRYMEFVHITDQTPAFLEPVAQLSGYKYSGTIGY